MTHAARYGLRWLPLGLALALLGSGGCALAEDPPSKTPLPELPKGAVAQIYGKDGQVLATLDARNLAGALVQHVLRDLPDQEGGRAMTVLRELIEEALVQIEAKRLGLDVAKAEMDAYVQKLDRKLRATSGGQQTLEELRKGQGMSWETFQAGLRSLLLKEKVAAHPQHLGQLPDDERKRMSQVAVVITELHKRAKIVYHVAVSDRFLQQAGQKEPLPGPPGAIVTVHDQVIDSAAFGKALYERLPEDILKEVVDKECTTKLLAVDAVALDDGTMEEEIQLRERNWLVQRTLLSQTDWHKVEYAEYVKAALKLTREELKADRYYRSYYGLVRRERLKLTEKQMADEWAIKSKGAYGDAIVVDAVQIGFERKNAFGGSGGRDRAQALSIAHGVMSQVARGQAFKDILRDLEAKHRGDPTVRGGERRLYNTQADQLLFEEAKKLRDGETSPAPIETLSEVHVLRRKHVQPGPSYETVKEVMREMLAGREAEKYMVKSAKDPSRVRVRWPIRER